MGNSTRLSHTRIPRLSPHSPPCSLPLRSTATPEHCSQSRRPSGCVPSFSFCPGPSPSFLSGLLTCLLIRGFPWPPSPEQQFCHSPPHTLSFILSSAASTIWHTIAYYLFKEALPFLMSAQRDRDKAGPLRGWLSRSLLWTGAQFPWELSERLVHGTEPELQCPTAEA